MGSYWAIYLSCGVQMAQEFADLDTARQFLHNVSKPGEGCVAEQIEFEWEVDAPALVERLVLNDR